MRKILILALLTALTTGCRKSQAEMQAEYNAKVNLENARARIMVTKSEPEGCRYITAESVEGWDYDGAVTLIKDRAVSNEAEVVVLDQAEATNEGGIRGFRVSGRLFDCP